VRPIGQIIALVALVVAIPAVAQDDKLFDAAKKDGKLAVYGTCNPTFASPCKRPFKRKLVLLSTFGAPRQRK